MYVGLRVVRLQYRNSVCAWPLVNRAVVPQTHTSGLLKPGTFGIPSGTLGKFLASLNLPVEILNFRSRLYC